MPIRKDLIDQYPANWQEIRTKILHRSDHRCERCGLKNGVYGLRDLDGNFHHAWEFADGSKDPNDDTFHPDAKAFEVVITIGHLDHNVMNNDEMDLGGPALPMEDANLIAMCCQCHNRHDGPHRGANRVLTWDKKRGQGRFDFNADQA